MSTADTCCTIVPYFKVPEENLTAFKVLCEKAVKKSQEEAKCLYYGFSFSAEMAFCREGYSDAQGVLAHLGNVKSILQEMFALAELVKIEIHGPAAEIDQLRGPLGSMNPDFFVLEYGFRR